jgi:mannan endo-1,4-beta-mannosidase
LGPIPSERSAFYQRERKIIRMSVTRRDALVGAAALTLLGTKNAAARSVASKLTRGVLSNPVASTSAKTLYAYLWSIYGKHTLTGQQEQNFAPEGPRLELDYLQRTTGKQPALLGLDYIDPRDERGVNERALQWHRSGGIVSICWHWGAPTVGTGYENSKRDFNVSAALRKGSPENQAMMAQMAHVADLLAVLRDEDVPVLWRPFHEFSGEWFWWGKHGAEAFKALWRLMYDFYTRERRLDNLIWVLGYAGQNIDESFYPGRGFVDIAGADIYVDDHSNQAGMFAAVKGIVRDTVPICLHENGPIPDPATLGPSADWLWFMTWHTKWLTDPKQNAPDLLARYYRSDRYLTLDELPRR